MPHAGAAVRVARGHSMGWEGTMSYHGHVLLLKLNSRAKAKAEHYARLRKRGVLLGASIRHGRQGGHALCGDATQQPL